MVIIFEKFLKQMSENSWLKKKQNNEREKEEKEKREGINNK